MSLNQRFIIDKKVKRSIIQSVSRMYSNYDWEEGQTRKTKKYSTTFRFNDQGVNFLVIDLSNGKEYYVNGHIDYGWSISKKGERDQ